MLAITIMIIFATEDIKLMKNEIIQEDITNVLIWKNQISDLCTYFFFFLIFIGDDSMSQDAKNKRVLYVKYQVINFVSTDEMMMKAALEFHCHDAPKWLHWKLLLFLAPLYDLMKFMLTGRGQYQ